MHIIATLRQLALQFLPFFPIDYIFLAVTTVRGHPQRLTGGPRRLYLAPRCLPGYLLIPVVAGNNIGGTFGAHFGLDIPNPVRGAVSGFQQAGQDMRNVGTQIGRQAGDAYRNLERQPGVSVGFNGSVDVNGKQYGGSRTYNIDNPLPGMRRDAETARDRADAAYNTVADRTRRIGSEAGRKMQDEYPRMENMPTANFGGNAGVNVNGRQYGMQVLELFPFFLAALLLAV